MNLYTILNSGVIIVVDNENLVKFMIFSNLVIDVSNGDNTINDDDYDTDDPDHYDDDNAVDVCRAVAAR